MQAHFFTFASSKYSKAADRILSEAQSVFDTCTAWTEKHMSQEYWERTAPYCYAERGFGYWLWKPFLLYRAIQSLKEGDILVYADAGSTIQRHPQALERLHQYYSILQNNCCIRFRLSDDCVEHEYSTRRACLALDANWQDCNTAQMHATVILFKVCDASRKLLREWYELAMHRADMFSDMYNSESKFLQPFFKDHRHDQSIFSLLTKRHIREGAAIAVLQDETLLAEQNRHSPILATRKRFH